MSESLPPPNPQPGDFADLFEPREPDAPADPVAEEAPAQPAATPVEPPAPASHPSDEPNVAAPEERPHDAFAHLTAGTDGNPEMAPNPAAVHAELGTDGEIAAPARVPSSHSDWDENWVLGPGGGIRGAGRSRRRWQVAGSIALVLVLVAAGFMFLSSGGGSQALALEFVRGHTDHYRLNTEVHLTGSVPGMSRATDATLQANLEWRVHRVGDDGVAGVDLAMSKIQIHVDGNSVDAPQQASASMKIASDGRVLSAAGLDESFGGSGSQPAGGTTSAGQQIAPVLPEGDVSIGDSWSRTFTQQMPGGADSITVKSTSRYVRNQTLDGVDTAVVQTDYDIPIDASIPVSSDQGIQAKGTIHDAVTSWVDLSSKRLDQVVSNTTADLTLRAGSDSSSALTMHETALTTLRRV